MDSSSLFHHLPAVSCMCVTYGRVHLLEEAIESFLRQDYPGPKELVIVNDFDQQELVCEAPEVVIFNLPQRFCTLGGKRNACALLCRYTILLPWDDDDIHLPHRLSLSVERLSQSSPYFKPTTAYFWNNGVITELAQNTFPAQGAWTRQIFETVGGYSHTSTGEDAELEGAFQEHGFFKRVELPVEQNFYLHRWAGTDSPHLSAFGFDQAGQISGYQRIDDHLRSELEAGHIPRGTILLKPHWREDYFAQVRDFLARQAV